jgi:hypothetical protein
MSEASVQVALTPSVSDENFEEGLGFDQIWANDLGPVRPARVSAVEGKNI